MKYHLIVIGGGAAGFFGAINYAEIHPHHQVLILEKSSEVLSKVRVSGGGRCNVTHACFEPEVLVDFYPRGKKELLSCFHRFQPTDTVAWFARHGVPLVKEADGRMFPQSNSSAAIINCFMKQIHILNIELKTSKGVKNIFFNQTSHLWEIDVSGQQKLLAQQILCATGSSVQFWKNLAEWGLKINPPIPSLFAFDCKKMSDAAIPGISVPYGSVACYGRKIKSTGPILITHKGISGPAVLKLSSFEATFFHQQAYKVSLLISWNTQWNKASLASYFQQLCSLHAKQKIVNFSFQEIPARLWKFIVSQAGLANKNWGDLKKGEIEFLTTQVTEMNIEMQGKSTHKEEFVSCGGVALPQINFKTMAHKTIPNLYFAGEILDIDAVTGGFNFQAAWTTAWIAAQAMK